MSVPKAFAAKAGTVVAVASVIVVVAAAEYVVAISVE